MVLKNADIEIYVRFCETDAAGHVNNVSYYIYMEEARSKFFELSEMDDWKKRHGGKIHFVVVSTRCNYRRQAYAKQKLSVSTRISRIGNKSFEFEHNMKDAATGEIIADGGSVAVIFDSEKQQAVEIPEQIREVLKGYME